MLYTIRIIAKQFKNIFFYRKYIFLLYVLLHPQVSDSK